MKERLIVSVPKSIPVEDLLSQLGLSRTKTKSMKFKMYYFISLLVSTNENSHLNAKNHGYRHISSVMMRKILGRKEYYMILKVLMESQEPCIESNHSWQKSTKGKKGTSIGYRLTFNHIHSEIEYKTLPETLQARINKHLYSNYNFDDRSYQFLYDQFKHHRLSLDSRVYDYVYRFGSRLLSKAEYGNKYHLMMIHNHIGKWLDKLSKIRDNDMRAKVSPTNHRLNSSFTFLNKALRQFVLCDGQILGMIDISAAQPYFMASAMSNSFLEADAPGYNLKTIYPQMFDALVSKNMIIPCAQSYFSDYCSYSGNTDCVSYFSTSTGSSMGELKTKYPFIWGLIFDGKEQESIRRYQESPFDKDFYKHYITSNYSCYPDQTTDPESFKKFREKIKKNVLYVLNDENKTRRKNIESFKIFREDYPGVDKWITSIQDPERDLSVAYLLQRTESYVMLKVICQEFHSKYPNAPIFTIHDAICTFPEYMNNLQEMIRSRCHEITGLSVGTKTENFEVNIEPKFEDIEEIWKKIRSIDCESKYRKIAFKVHPYNIERGSLFMQNFMSGERKLA